MPSPLGMEAIRQSGHDCRHSTQKSEAESYRQLLKNKHKQKTDIFNLQYLQVAHEQTCVLLSAHIN